MLSRFKKFIISISPYVFSRKNKNYIRSSSAILLDLFTSSINIAAPVVFADNAKKLSNNPSDDVKQEAYIYMGCSIGFLLLAQILPKTRNMLINPVRANVQKELTTEMTKKCYELELDLHLTTRTGEFSQALTKNYSTIDKGLPTFFGELVPILFETAGTSLALTINYGPVGLIQLGILTAYLSAASWGEKSAEKIRTDCTNMSYKAYGVVIETINNYQIAHQFNNVNHELQRAEQSLADSELAYSAQHRKDDVNALFLSIINGVGFAGALALLGYLTKQGNLEVADFALFTYFMTRFNTNLDKLPQAFSSFHTAMADSERITKFLKRSPLIVDRNSAVPLNSLGPLEIQFENISFQYPQKEVKALDNISFKINAREKVAIVGPTASGKSTLVKLLLKFYQPGPGGSITVNGFDIAELSSTSLRSHIAVVAQDSVMLNNSIKENIRYGDLTANDDEVISAARLAKIFPEDKVVSLSNQQAIEKLNTNVGQAGGKLSGGEKQRASLARTLLKERKLYILDEPTTALDPKTAHEVQSLLDSITANSSVLIITHELRTVVNADRIYYLHQGRIVETGSFNELMDKRGQFYEQFCIECAQQEININDIKRPQRDIVLANSLSQFWAKRNARQNSNIEFKEQPDDLNEVMVDARKPLLNVNNQQYKS